MDRESPSTEIPRAVRKLDLNVGYNVLVVQSLTL